MTLVIDLAAQVLHALLVLIAGLFLPAIIDLLAARFAGTRGSSPAQAWHDIARLLRKDYVLAESVSRVFTAAPAVCLGMLVTAALLVPSFTLGMALGPLNDLLTVALLLCAERLVLVLAAIDSGTAAGGIAARRLFRWRLWSDLALLLTVYALTVPGAGATIDAIARAQQQGLLLAGGPMAFAAAGLAIVAFLFAAQPDDAFIREYSGRDLAMLRLAQGVRLIVWADLLGALFVPFGIATGGIAEWPLGLITWLGRLAAAAIVLAAARVRFSVPTAAAPTALAIAAVVAILAMAGPAMP